MRLTVRADVGVGAFAVAPSSRDVALAGKSGLYIVDLLDPFALPRWLPLRNAWDVASVKWSPHASAPARVASTSNQKVLLWDLASPGDRAVEAVMQGHRRAVTDLAFSAFSPNELASASIDTSVCVWDLRRSALPALRFTDFAAGAVQVKMSQTNEHQLVSAHNHRIVLWDRRRANAPLHNFAAHAGECTGVELLPSGKLLTCSADRTVKLWDLPNERCAQPELQIDCGFPVLKARPTPYELGALVVPLRGHQHTATIVNLARQSGVRALEDVAVTDGHYSHPEPVLGAAFMRSDRTAAHYDVVTWCQDARLRVWNGRALLNLPHASSAAGCKDDLPPGLGADVVTYTEEPASAPPTLRTKLDIPVFNRRRNQAPVISHIDWIAGVHVDHEPVVEVPSTDVYRRPSRAAEELSQEIVAVSAWMPRVSFDNIDVGGGTCLLRLRGPWGANGAVVPLYAGISVPRAYPAEPMAVEVRDAPPAADHEGLETAEPAQDLPKMNAFLASACSELSRHSVRSLEFCVRYLVGDHVAVEDELASEAATATFNEHAGLLLSPPLPNLGTPEISAASSPDLMEYGGFALLDDEYGALDAPLDTPLTEEFADPKPAVANADALPAGEVIDSTPVPRSCGAVWSNAGRLVCFFTPRQSPARSKKPLPLDRVFADDSSVSEPFLSDSDDFAADADGEWASTAARLGSHHLSRPGRTVLSASDETSRALGPRPGINFTAALHRVANAATSHTLPSLASEDTRAPTDANRVIVKDFSHLWPCRPELAREYSMNVYGSPTEMVEHNVVVATKHGLHADVVIWRLLLNYICSEESKYANAYTATLEESPKFEWSGGGTGFQRLLPEIADDLERKGNLQLLVGILIALSALRTRRTELAEAAARQNPMVAAMTILEPNAQALFQLNRDGTATFVGKRSESDGGRWPDASKAASPAPPEPTAVPDPRADYRNALSAPSSRPPSNHKLSLQPVVGFELLDDRILDFHPQTSVVFSQGRSHDPEKLQQWFPRLIAYRRLYAKLLHTWGLDLERAEVLKSNTEDPLVKKFNLDFVDSIAGTESTAIGLNYRCCSLCQTAIAKTFAFCGHCSHAMHSACAQEWWSTQSECPAACGCTCKSYLTV